MQIRKCVSRCILKFKVISQKWYEILLTSFFKAFCVILSWSLCTKISCSVVLDPTYCHYSFWGFFLCTGASHNFIYLGQRKILKNRKWTVIASCKLFKKYEHVDVTQIRSIVLINLRTRERDRKNRELSNLIFCMHMFHLFLETNTIRVIKHWTYYWYALTQSSLFEFAYRTLSCPVYERKKTVCKIAKSDFSKLIVPIWTKVLLLGLISYSELKMRHEKVYVDFLALNICINLEQWQQME